jgi:hypothetical protein
VAIHAQVFFSIFTGPLVIWLHVPHYIGSPGLSGDYALHAGPFALLQVMMHSQSVGRLGMRILYLTVLGQIAVGPAAAGEAQPEVLAPESVSNVALHCCNPL